jgi:hypothetical protein
MSTGKRTLKPYKLVDAQSLGASFTSAPTVVENLDRVALDIQCTGAPVGDVVVQGSVNYDAAKPAAQSTWFDLPLGLTSLSAAPQDYTIDMQETALRALRIDYRRTSGTGAMSAWISGKES